MTTATFSMTLTAIPSESVAAIAEMLGYSATDEFAKLVAVAGAHLLTAVTPHVTAVDWDSQRHREAVAKVLGQSILERNPKPPIPLVVRAAVLQGAF